MHLLARHADALTRLTWGMSDPPPSVRNWMNDTADASHDRVMLAGGGSDPVAGSASLIGRIRGSCCSRCDACTCWQSEPRQPILHSSAKRFDATDATADGGAVQVNPFNPDITPNEWSGR
jgi:hypothetical protein